LLRSRQHVGVAQVVQAAAGADELAVPGRALHLGGEGAQLAARLAPGVGRKRTPAQRGAIERAQVLRVLCAPQAGDVVAPQGLVLVPVHAQVEPALARRPWLSRSSAPASSAMSRPGPVPLFWNTVRSARPTPKVS